MQIRILTALVERGLLLAENERKYLRLAKFGKASFETRVVHNEEAEIREGIFGVRKVLKEEILAKIDKVLAKAKL